MQLRPYQTDTIAAIFNWWKTRPADYPLVVLPTAAGKTIVFSTLIKQLLESYPTIRIMVLAHTLELVEQANNKLSKVFDGAPVGVYCAGLGRKEIKQITIASRDSIRKKSTVVGRFDLVMIDEAHLISTKENTSYRKIIAALAENSPGLSVVGFTATPYRTGTGYIYGDGKLFADVAYSKTIRDLLRDGYLCPVTAKAVDDSSITNGDGLKITGGDFNAKELAELVERNAVITAAVDEWMRLAFEQGRKATAFFCASVAHAELVSKELMRRGVFAPVVTGNTDKKERGTILKEFAAGNIKAICNVACLTTGWDSPNLDCIALLRPTRSLALFIQIVGRGLRLHSAKKNTLLLDFGGNLERFGSIDQAAPPARKGREDKRIKECPQCASLVGYHKRRCECGYEFEPQPVKDCPQCGAELHPSATVCSGCQHVFVKHEPTAARLAVFSDDAEPILKEHRTNGVRLFERKGKNGENWLQVAYRISDFDYVRRSLCLDARPQSVKQVLAAQLWNEITLNACLPTSTALAMSWYNHALKNGQDFLRPVFSVVVNESVKTRPVVSVNYVV